MNDAYNQLFINCDKNNVTEDLDFISNINDVYFVYISGNPNVITNTGKVTRTSNDVIVLVTIKVLYCEHIIENYESFNVTRLKEDETRNIIDYINKFNRYNSYSINLNVYNEYHNETKTSEYNYKYYNGIITYNDSSNNPVYKFKENNIDTGIYQKDGLFYKTYDGEEDYTNFILNNFIDININKLEQYQFNYDNNTFISSDLNQMYKDFLSEAWLKNAFYDFTSFNVGLFNNEIKTIVINANVTMDDKTYKQTLTYTIDYEEQVIILPATNIDACDILKQVGDKLFEGNNRQSLTTDLLFYDSIQGVSIRYQSSDETVISNTGKVIRNNVDKTVTITATLTYLGFSEVRTFDFVIPKIEEVDENFKNIIKTLSELTSFSVLFTVNHNYQDDEEYNYSQTTLMQFDNDKIMLESEDGYLFYIVENENEHYGIYSDGYINYKVEYGTDDYDLYIIYYSDYYDLCFSLIDSTNYAFSDGVYKAIKNVLVEGKNIIGDYDYIDDEESYKEEIDSVEIKTVDNKVSEIKIYATAYYSGVEDIYTEKIIYEIDFDYTKVTITLPETTETSGNQTIEDVYNGEDEESFYIGGIITGFMGDNIYLMDDTGSINLYIGGKNSTVDFKGYSIGDYVEVLGVKDTYNGLIELVDITMLKDDESKNIEFIPRNLFNLDDVFDISNQSEVVNLNNLKVTSAYTKSGTKGDYYFTVSDGENSIKVFVKYTIEKSFHDDLNNLKVNDLISLNNIVIGYFKEPQLSFVSSSSLSNNIGLILTMENTSFELDTEISVILDNLNVSFFDGTKEIRLSDSEYKVDYSNVNTNVNGYYDIIISYLDYKNTVTIKIKRAKTDAFVPTDAVRLDDVKKTYNLPCGMPSSGDVNVLVFPIAFNDIAVPSDYREVLERGFNGTSEETGYESLKSYYLKSSFGKLNITADIRDIYYTNEVFDPNAKYDDALDYEYLAKILEANDNKIDYSKYDLNNDKSIDAIYLIYIAPYYYDEDSLWWAFTDIYMDEDEERYDGVECDYYAFISYEFFNEPLIEDSDIDNVYVTTNATTIIHETAHMLGVDDYYDYDFEKGPAGGIGGSDMMDNTVGDHNAYTKTILGWVTPTVVINKDCEMTLSKATTSGDCIVIPKDWNNTFYDEYYIIDFYTPTDLYEPFSGFSGIFSISGIRIYHVDSTLKSKGIDNIFNVTKYNNTDTQHKVLSLVEADGKNDIENKSHGLFGGLSEDSDLFTQGMTFKPKWYDKTDCGFTLKVLSIDNNQAKIFMDFE